MKLNKSKLVLFLENYWPLLGYVFISIIFLFPILRQGGISLKYDWSWPIFDMKEFWRHLFDSSFQGLFSTPGKYMPLFLGLPGLFKLSPSISLKLFLLVIHTIAGYGFYLFIKRKIESKLFAFVIGLAYAFSPYIFIRTIVGFVPALIAYAVLPLFLIIYFRPKKKFGQYLLSALLLSLIFSQFQAGVLVVLFLSVNLIFSFNKSSLKNFVLTILSLAVLALPWYVAGFFIGGKIVIPTGSEVVTLKFIADLPHSLRNVLMLSDHAVTSSFFYGFARRPIVAVGFALIYLIAGFSIFDRKNRSLALPLIFFSILILPFSVGPTGKFTSFYTYIFNHFPQIALFRETYHFEFWLSFALITLFAFGLVQILRWLQSIRLVTIITKTIAILLTLVIIAPYFSFNYAGYFSLYQIPSAYRDAKNFLSANNNFCTKAYYPLNLGFVYFKDDTSPDAVNSDLIASALGVPYLTDGSSVLNMPTSEMFLRNRLTSQFLEKSDDGEVVALMKRAGVDCLIIRTDMDTKYNLVSGLWLETDRAILDKWNNKDLLGLALNKKGLKLEKQFGDKIYIFKLDSNIVIPDLVGDPLIVDSRRSLPLVGGNDNTILPLTSWASEFDKYKDGWSRGRYAFWRKKLFADLEQDFIYTNRQGSVLTGKVDTDGGYELLTRYLDGGVAGSFEIKIRDTRYEIQKNPGVEKFVIKNLGKISLKKGDEVKITNISGENAIADLILLKE